MNRLYGEGFQWDHKAIAVDIEGCGKTICSVSGAVYLKRASIEKAVAVEAHCGIRDGSGSITRKNSSGYASIQCRQRRQSANAGRRHGKIPDFGDLIRTEACQCFR
jgi:ribosomal protein L19E